MANAKKTTKKVEQKAKDMSAAQKFGLGVGLTAAAVTAAGAYFLYGSKDAAKNRKTVKSWMLKAKAEVLEQMERAEDMTKEEYMQVVDTVAAVYAKVKDSTKTDIDAFKREMKSHWPEIERVAKSTAKKAGKAASAAAAKHLANKASKKAASKARSKSASSSGTKKATAKKSTNKPKKTASKKTAAKKSSS